MSGDCRSWRMSTAAGTLRALQALLVLCLLSFTAQMVPPHAACAAGRLEPELADKLRRRGDLTLTLTPLSQALFIISDKWDIDIVVGETVQGVVNGKFTDAELHEILHSILHVNGFGYRVVGQSLAVMKLEDLGDVNPLFESTTIHLRAANATEVMEGAKLFLSPQGKIQAVESAGCVLVVDLPERLALITRFAEELDGAAAAVTGGSVGGGHVEIAQFAPQFIEAESLLESAQAALSKDGKATVIKEENRLVVADYPAGITRVRELVRQVDVPRPQVRITALVYDVSREDLERLGVNWSHGAKGRLDGTGEAQSLWSMGSVMHVPVSAADPSSVMTFMNLSRHIDLTTVVAALDQMRDSRLLMNPMVSVRDRETASFQIVTEVPYQQLVQTEAGGNIGTTAFREAGVILRVTPHIADDATIQLEVNPIFSRLTGFTSGATPQPIIDKRETQTSVRVANYQTLVIGGLRQRTDVNDFRGVPGLKDLRYKWFHLGKLFQSHENTVQESELVVFVTPEIITPIHCGLPREKAAFHAGNALLDQIPPLEVHVAPMEPGMYPGEVFMEEVHPGSITPVPTEAQGPPGPSPLEMAPPQEVHHGLEPQFEPAPPRHSSRRQAPPLQTAQPQHLIPPSHVQGPPPRTARLPETLSRERPRLQRLPPISEEVLPRPPQASPATLATDAAADVPAAQSASSTAHWLQRIFRMR